MAFVSGPAPSNHGYFAALGDFHLELRRYQDQWEYQVISLKPATVVADGLHPQFEQSRNAAIEAAKRIAPALDWDRIEWQPIQTGE